MAAKKNEPVTKQNLDDIRNAVREIDIKRRDASLTPGEREVLELSATALRDAERLATISLQKQVVTDMEKAVTELKTRSSALRARITRMGKVPKALDRIESVLGMAVSVLKGISKWSFVLLVCMVTAASCSVLTKSQIKMVNALAVSSDTLTRSPSVIFTSLAQVREGRGVLYAATMSSPEAHFREVRSLYDYSVKESAQIRKAESYVRVLNSYCRALRSLANTNRWEQYGVEFRGIGRKADSLLIALNDTGWLEDDITEGLARLSGRYAGLLAESVMKCRQAKAIREFVTEADTLVSACVSDLTDILKSDEMTGLIAHEKTALEDDYRAFLDAACATDQRMALCLEGDRAYLTYSQMLDASSSVRTKCVSALRSFASAHSKLAQNLQKRSRTSGNELAEDIYADIIELNTITAGMVKLF